MRILYLSAYYKPETAASLYIFENINESLINAGNDIILYTPMPTRGISSEVRREYKKKKIEEQYNGKLKIIRFSMFREGKHPARRAIRYIYCSIKQFINGLFIKNIDLITIASTPPTQGFLAAILKKIKKVPIVYYLQDIFPDSLVNSGLTKENSVLWKIGRAIENFTYRNVDKIIVISDGFKNNIMKKGVPEEKIRVIYNWVDETAVINIERKKNNLFDKYNLDRHKFYITYSGNIGHTQNMDMLLEIAKELENYNDILFVLVGDGVYKKDVERQICKKNIKNVKLIPFQSYEDVSSVFSLGDVGLVISKANIGQNSVPSKTWSIMSAERYVLASFDMNSELSTIIRKADCGFCIPADNREALKNKIFELYNDRSSLDEKGKNGRRYILENLTRAKGTEKYGKVINEIWAKKSLFKNSK